MMPHSTPGTFRSWSLTRYGFALAHLVALLVGFLLLRIVLLVAFKPAGPVAAGEWLRLFAVGLHLDLVVALALTCPLVAWFTLAPNRWFGRRWHRWLLLGGMFFFWVVQLYLLAAEYFFFEEFKSRYNTVAIDYLFYPKEVFVNIRDTYPVGTILCLCLAGAAVIVGGARCFAGRMWEVPIGKRTRLLNLGGAFALALGLAGTIRLAETRFSQERVFNEIASNGTVSVLTAWWSRNLDYSAFYPTMPAAEAWARVRRQQIEVNATPSPREDSLQRRIAGDPQRPRLNVVLLLEESLGSEFWGSLGRKEPTLTPYMDKLATEEGWLFTNLYATGNRTVRGFEGVLASFPPLPGDSIVKRDRSENVETIARVLKRDGYETVFLYGGRGLFDGMRSFAVQNGYDRFVEQKHFPKPTFTTIWGVCNEDLYQRTIEECRALAQKGTPFFATVLSVSNHKPFTYPPGRIAEDPNARQRAHAVKYTDWALGQFFAAVKSEPFYRNTIFVVVADHGARVYGSQSIPIHSYEIPLVVLGPAVVKSPRRLPQLGCQLDIAPTLLGLLGRPYHTLFYGHDLLKEPRPEGRVLINHNRDIGLLRGDRMVVLSLNKRVEFYRGDPKTETMARALKPDETDRELEKDAIAFFQTADLLYMNRKYRVEVTPQSAP